MSGRGYAAIHPMNIEAIRLFHHVMQRGSLAAAAAKLNMSPSAASRALSGLERSTGLKLFSRDGQRLRPTLEGEQYHLECRQALLAVDELPRVAWRLARGAQSQLKVLAGSRLASVLALPAIESFTRSNPNVEIDLEVVRVNAVDRIRAGLEFDVALGAPVPTGMPLIDVEPLFEMPVTAVMRRDHILADRNYVHAADLAGHKLIATASGQAREDLDNLFEAEGLEARPHFTVSSIDVGCSLVLRTGAVAVADPSVLLSANRDEFAVIPLRPAQMIQVSMITRTMRPESRLVRDFKNCLMAEAKLVERRLSSVFQRSAGTLTNVKTARARRKRG